MTGGKWIGGGRALATGVALAALATGLGACGSHGSPIAQPPETTTTAAAGTTATTGPGWEDGVWVGTGSAQDQELVYVAKESAIWSDLAGESDAASDWAQVAQYVTPGFLQQLRLQLQRAEREHERFVDATEDGIATAQAKVVTQPATVHGFTSASVEVCAVGQERYVADSTGKPIPGLLGAVGPELGVYTETRSSSSSTWLLNATIGKAIQRCPSR